MGIVAAWCVVALGAQALEVGVAPPALEGEGAALDAPDGVGAGDEGDVGVTDGFVFCLVLRAD